MPQPKPARKRPPKKRRRRRAPARRGLPFVPVLLGVGAVAAVVVAVVSVGSDSQATVSERIVTVSNGVVQSIVSGSGNLEPANQLDVDFATTGRITKIYVAEGDHVSKGDLLAKLDSASQRVELAQAQAQLVEARDARTKAEDAASEDTAAASGDGGTTIAVAAQVTPTATPPVTATATPSATATPHASATPSAGADSSSSSGGGPTQSVESASAAVQSAELAVQQAQDALEATTLRAPAAGTIASISNKVGDAAGSGPFIVLAQLSKLKLEVALSESDIGKVEVGQKATVTVNAASGEQVAAHVSEIGVLSSSSDDSSQGSDSSGAVSYPVVVTLDQTTDGVRAGMSATADIVTSQASGIVVPNQALRGSTVTLVASGQRTTQRVETGVAGDSTTQVVSGLRDGDRVVITSTSALAGGAASGATANQLRQRLGGAAGGLGGATRGFGGPPAGGGGFRPGG
jgi:multidrug efflux pump subunit AcrA (membrane-fusion protein)